MTCWPHKALSQISSLLYARRSKIGEEMYQEKIQGDVYPLKYVSNLHVQYSEHPIHHFPQLF